MAPPDDIAAIAAGEEREPIPQMAKGLYERLCEVVAHHDDCPANGRGDEFCNCDAVASLDDARIVIEWTERERRAWRANAVNLYEIATVVADDLRPGWKDKGGSPMTAILDAFTDLMSAHLERKANAD